MASRLDYRDNSTHNYPPRNKTDLIHLVKDCSQFRRDMRDLFNILQELEYRVISTRGTGVIRGFSHDRMSGSMKIQIKTDDSREVVELKEIVKLEALEPVEIYP